ncbi:MAG: MerR family transcriptional regulator [Candidatus Marinimicrobia bacterium]|nr:MerR family transcriptional regulator [Candidatus Neomarinimicrobiota bacterium]
MGSRDKETITIGKLAARAMVPPTTIRYYERIGLLPVPSRTRSRYRLYSVVTVKRLRFIRKAIGLGLQLEEIKSLLVLTDQGICPCGQVQTIFRQHIKEVNRKIQGYEKKKPFRIEEFLTIINDENKTTYSYLFGFLVASGASKIINYTINERMFNVTEVNEKVKSQMELLMEYRLEKDSDGSSRIKQIIESTETHFE